MGYSLVIALLSYIGAIQLSLKFNTRPAVATTVAVVLPTVVGLFLQYLYVTGYDLPVAENLFTVSATLVFAIQFFIAYVVFSKLQEEENILPWLAWGVAGAICIYFVVPFGIGYVV